MNEAKKYQNSTNKDMKHEPMLSAVDGWATLPTVEFTEDEWNTVYHGSCIDSTVYSYLVSGVGYGTFWIPKCYVRLANC